MNYPLISEYVESIKLAEDNFDELSYLRPVLDADGQPVMSSGNFAVVFKMKDERDGKLYAVRCFHRDQEGRAESYKLIEEELKDVESPYLVSFRYMDKELYVDSKQSDETEFPVLLMDWADGITLDKYLREKIDDIYALEMLAYRFSQLAQWLIPQPFAHGDLKPDNILVREDGTLVLVDYDGMYVPAMKGQKARELGSPDFRHPFRTEDDFDEHIDDFPFVSILLSLKAISLNPQLLEEYGTTDRLLLSEKDYRNVSDCRLLKEHFPSIDETLNRIAGVLFIVLTEKELSFYPLLLRFSKPQRFIEEIYSTKITDKDLANGVEDEDGVVYSNDGNRLLECANNRIRNYEVKRGTKVICDNAFSCCQYLESINIPDSVIEIGNNPFRGCISQISCQSPYFETDEKALYNKGMTHLIAFFAEDEVFRIPDSVVSIGNSAFLERVSLQTIHIPASVNHIADGAFAHCNSLQSIRIPDGVTSIGDGTFGMCYSLKFIHIPNSVTSIGKMAFLQCVSLQTIHIPASMTSIGNGAFYECHSLQSIHIPDGVSDIGDGAFFGCSSLQFIFIPQGTRDKFEKLLPENKDKLIEQDEERNHSTKVTDEDLANAWTDEYGALYSADKQRLLKATKSIKVYDIRKGTQVICDRAFLDCGDLTDVTIPNSVISIGHGAFSNCPGLTSIIIPNSVTSIGNGAFAECTGLTSIIIPNSVTTIGVCSFEDCENLMSVTISENITCISDSAFSKCFCLNSVKLPNGIKSIGNCSFHCCYDLMSISIPDSVTSIGNHAFSHCKSLTSVIIPKNVTSIGDHAFDDCGEMKFVVIPNSVTTIGEMAFFGCSILSSIIIPNSVTCIGNQAFACCGNLTSVTIPNSVTSIGKGVLDMCSGLTSIEVDIENKYYDSRNHCNAIIEKTTNTLIAGCRFSVVPDGVESISEMAFRGCIGLASLTIPDTVTSIGWCAFEGCHGLTSMVIPDNIKSIGNNAFANCINLSTIYIHVILRSVGWGAFSGCNSLNRIKIPEGSVQHFEALLPDCKDILDDAPPHYPSEINDEDLAKAWEDEYGVKYSADKKRILKAPKSLKGADYEIKEGTLVVCDCAFQSIGLHSITLPNSVQIIGRLAFANNNDMEYCNIPSSVNYIYDNNPWGGCFSIKKMDCSSPLYKLENGILYSSDYKNLYGIIYWQSHVSIDYRCEVISGNAFWANKEKWNSLIKVITMPRNLTSIGNSAFCCCSGLQRP